jgi:hypothetical protein
VTAIGTERRYHAGARVRVVDGAHAGRCGVLLTSGEPAAEIVHVELDGSAERQRGAFVRIRLGALVPLAPEVAHA